MEMGGLFPQPERLAQFGHLLVGFISFKKKLQHLKLAIREWIKSKKAESNKIKSEHQLRLSSIDAKVDQGSASENDLVLRRESIKILGDENTSFFHGMLKKKRRQLAIRGVFKDGEWIEDSSNEFLELVMAMLGFGTKWCMWIFGCLRNARASVVVNGSPTCEFKIQRGLRQGDSLSHFLFILAMVGLHVLTCKAMTMGLFKGVSVGNDRLNISHLIYADDVIFLGIGVSDEEVSNMANVIGCEAAKFPLKYLGVPIIREKDVLGEMEEMLSEQRFGMSWYRKHLWAEFRASFQMGLEIFTPWSGILSSIRRLKSKGIDLLSLCARKIGNGASCRFWDDIWCGISDWIAVFRRPPRGGAETSQFNDLLSLIQDVVLSDSSDSWMWSVDASSGYTVASGRTLIDSNILDVAPKATRWNRLIPNKVNVFIWRLMLNKLPTKVNLDRRDIDVGSILCPICLESSLSGSMTWLFPTRLDRILMVLGTLSCGIYGSSEMS
ncbi:RNA-directed DNA polymerase, eukaryota, reverse transcriptase zinc-binding domain protein [Tanacetum coccineum]